MAYNDEGGAGVGGWLALFVIFMMILTPAATIVSTAAALYGGGGVDGSPAGRTLEIFAWSLAAIITAGCWYVAWRLNKVQVWQTVRITIAWLWILAVGSTGGAFVGVALITGVPVSVLAEGAALELARPLAFAGLWTAYFLRSKRVANTYPRSEDPQEVAEVFG
jgi:hypothetical protein